MVYIIKGEDGSGVIHFGPRSNPKRDKYWAENGIIRYENTETNAYRTYSMVEIKERILGLDLWLKDKRKLVEQGIMTVDEWKRNHDFLMNMLELRKRAKAQGCPEAPDAAKWKKPSKPVHIAKTLD